MCYLEFAPSTILRVVSKEDIQMAKKTHEKMFNITGHKENAKQIQAKILPHSC
jgi:hypothetical protein